MNSLKLLVTFTQSKHLYFHQRGKNQANISYFYLRAFKSNKESVSYNFNILLHKDVVHSNEFYREGLCEKLLLNDNSILDDFFDPFFKCLVFEVP